MWWWRRELRGNPVNGRRLATSVDSVGVGKPHYMTRSRFRHRLSRGSPLQSEKVDTVGPDLGDGRGPS